MPHLPPELVFLALEHGYYTSYGSPNYEFLANCSLMCRAWTMPAQSLLVRKVRYLEWHRFRLLNAALMSPGVRGKLMGHAVRSVDISVRWREENWVCCVAEEFAQLLEVCPRLYELTLWTSSLYKFDKPTLIKLKHSGQSLRALRLPYCDLHSLLLFQILDIWPQVRFLDALGNVERASWRWQGIQENNNMDQPYEVGQFPPVQASLYELSLDQIPKSSALCQLLASSVSSLRILNLELIPDTAVKEVLAVHAPYLRSLRIQFSEHSSQETTFVQQCTRLEELVIKYLPLNATLPRLPPSIEHLRFKYGDPLPFTLNAIKVLPKLRLVSCPMYKEGSRKLETLKTQCAERGIDMVSPRGLFLHEDPVEAHSFPRHRSVLNFSLMTN